MNPFLKDPVAKPLDAKQPGGWGTPAAARRVTNLSRRAGAVMVAAGLAAGFPAQAIDVNMASLSQLESLRGVGPRTAKMIVLERTRAGAFASMEDLSDRVRGLGVRRVRALQAAGLTVRLPSAGQVTQTVSPNRAGPSQKKSKENIPDLVAKPEIISPQSF